MIHRYATLLVLLVLLGTGFSAAAQRVILIEKAGSARTQKIYEGQYLNFRLQGDDIWYEGDIMNLRVDQNLIEFGDRYVELDKIEALRRPKGWSQALGYSLLTFGVSWSGFALVGKLTDGDPETHYDGRDAIISGVSMGLGFGLSQLFRYKVYRFGKNRRLRMVDISFN